MGNNRRSLRATITRIGLGNGYTLTVSLSSNGRTTMMADRIADTVECARRMAAEVAADNDIPWNTVEVLYRQPALSPLSAQRGFPRYTVEVICRLLRRFIGQPAIDWQGHKDASPSPLRVAWP